jgi:tetratricopeptide (TPR) repeat protein
VFLYGHNIEWTDNRVYEYNGGAIMKSEDKSVIEVGGLLILGLHDEAEAAINELASRVSTEDAAFFCRVLKDNIAAHKLEAELAPPEECMINWQHNYDNMAAYEWQGQGEISPWLWNSELAKVKVNLKRARSTSTTEPHALLLQAAHDFWQCYLDSRRQDVLSLSRMCSVLMMSNQYSLVRRVLRELLAAGRQNFIPYFFLASLRQRESNFREALLLYDIVEEIIGDKKLRPWLLFERSLCHYFLGDFDQAVKLTNLGASKFEDFRGFANNHAFAQLRAVMREQGGKLWSKPAKAADILSGFVKSIKVVGWGGTSHFNIALMFFHASKEGKVKECLKAIKGRGDFTIENAVEMTFDRAKKAQHREHDYIHELASHYYLARVRKEYEPDPKRMILDELIWDADNFITEAAKRDKMHLARLRSDPELRKRLDFNHLATLKRWCHCPYWNRSQSDMAGGGYFVKWHGHGVVVNPGPAFDHYFCQRGYTADEISAIVVTSARHDCCATLPDLINHMRELAETRGDRPPTQLYVHPRVLATRPDLLSPEFREFCVPQPISLNRDTELCEGTAILRAFCPCSSACPEYGKCLGEPFGVSIDLGEGQDAMRVCFAADYCGHDSLIHWLADNSILLVSLGPVALRDFLVGTVGKCLQQALTTIRDNDPESMPSLGFAAEEMHAPDQPLPAKGIGYQPWTGVEGLVELWQCATKAQFVIVTDLPQELGDSRHRIARALNSSAASINQRRPIVLTADTGLVITLPTGKVFCEFENQPVDAASIDEECLEGHRRGAVRHFRLANRTDPELVRFLMLDC